MIKIIVHSPKGGVGKTTLATNIAMLLARRNYKVWALDLAQGAQMTDVLSKTPEFQQSQNKIQTEELGSLPTSFPSASQYDYLVADTDDYYNIMVDFASRQVRGWRIIVPIINEYNGLSRIPQEISEVMVANMFKGQQPFIKLFINEYRRDSDFVAVQSALQDKGIDELLSRVYIEHCDDAPPIFVDNETFKNQIINVLAEMGVII